MVVTSYVGDTQMATCPDCEMTAELPSDEFEQYKREPYRGYCSECDALVTWIPEEEE